MQESTAFDEAMTLLLRLGQNRFGQPDANVEAELSAFTDFLRLERMADAILTAKSWEELLATP